MLKKVQVKQLTHEEWESIENLIPLFEPINDASTTLGAVGHPTISLVHLLWETTMARITDAINPLNDPHPMVAQVGQVLVDCLKKRRGTSSFHDIALALDPRTKDMNFLAVNERNKIWDLLATYTEEFMDDQGARVEYRPSQDPMLRYSRPPSLHNKVVFEVIHWRSIPELPLRTSRPSNPDVYDYPDVFAFWGDHSKDMPMLAQVARMVLAIPATSVPSERVGSVAGNIARARRSKLSPDMIHDLTFGSMNWKFLSEAELSTLSATPVEDLPEQDANENKDQSESSDESESDSESEIEPLSEEESEESSESSESSEESDSGSESS